MSNPPRLATPDLRQRLPHDEFMVLRSQPAYISLTARRAQPAGPPPTQPTTTTTNPTQMREIHSSPLTTRAPYQLATRASTGY